jgi:hypothetical protein
MSLHAIYKQRHLAAATNKPDADQISKEEKKDGKVVLVVFSVLILLGVVTGFFLSRSPKALTLIPSTSNQNTTTPGAKAVGSSDSKTFKDFAEGTLQKGGLGNEGTHNLVRAGGPSQTVYLISSIVDLDQFVGQKVKVWGQTMAAKKAPWLMDVGRIEPE